MSEKIEPALTAEEWAVADEVKTAIVDKLGSPHAVAAVCLHNQPFGFVKVDVDALRDIAAEATELTGYWKYVISSVADRIEALLPPEIKRGRCPERMSGEVEHLFVFGKPTCECGERRSPTR